MQRLHVHSRSRFSLRVRAKDARGTFQELGAPLRDLVGVNVELLSQFGQRSGAYAAPLGPRSPSLSPLMAARATFALKAGLWFRRGRLVIVISSLFGIMPMSRG